MAAKLTTTTFKVGNAGGITKEPEDISNRPYNLRVVPLICAVAAASTTVLPKEFVQNLFNKTELIWLEGGRVRQTIWNDILSVTGTNTVILYGLIPLFISILAYWTVGMLYILMDIYNKPVALRRYKVQPGTNEPVDPKKLIKAMLQVLFNQTVVSFPVVYLGSNLFIYREMPDPYDLPPIHITAAQIFGCVIIEEIGFYYTHRIMHHKWIYKYIHKQHHEWTAPVSVVALYAHPLEHIASNLFPVVLGVLVFRCHASTAWLWFFFANVFTLNEHSGYHLPFLPSAEAHDFHHFKFNNCYGVLGILDYLHGTDQAFKKVAAGKRHRILTSLKSARELYPDEATTK